MTFERNLAPLFRGVLSVGVHRSPLIIVKFPDASFRPTHENGGRDKNCGTYLRRNEHTKVVPDVVPIKDNQEFDCSPLC